MTAFSHRRALFAALLLDVVFVILFAAIGRASHDEGVLGAYGSGLATTAWPFLVGLALGWVITRVWRHPAAPVRTGLGVWVTTVVVGMLLRATSDQGTAVAFIIVATITLFVFLVGWRALAHALRRRRRS
ncbi:general stress protein CsbA [Microbacterium endophyticum]|uniref:General stress protein CsbA n=1 Tax=Microbacterium endophyticum TaxID=1526412 RepID=A0A7W4YMT1_9MICO|nr:DUF3054 domain-containing protein [Microbacterium endophyticum]MBB2976795.1 general stress protein CsbA [Microbacterium endophyticum]NIK36568.1 general stress protein CsbA [Microbacterium endophyticum]